MQSLVCGQWNCVVNATMRSKLPERMCSFCSFCDIQEFSLSLRTQSAVKLSIHMHPISTYRNLGRLVDIPNLSMEGAQMIYRVKDNTDDI